MKVIRKLTAFIDLVSLIGGNSGAIAVFVVTIIVGYGILSRYLFHSPANWAFDISSILLVGIVFLGTALVLKEDRHICIDILTNRLSKRGQIGLRLVSSIFGLIYIGIFTWQSLNLVLWSYEGGMLFFGGSVRIPVYIPQLPIFLGVFLLGLQLLAKMSADIRSLLKKEG